MDETEGGGDVGISKSKPFDTVISGAGVSYGIELGDPSRVMPTGDQLALHAWDALVRGLEPPGDSRECRILDNFKVSALSQPRGLERTPGGESLADLQGVRLEYLMQIIFDAVEGRGGPPLVEDRDSVPQAGWTAGWASSFYSYWLAGGLPDQRHFLLRELGEQHLTVNMDLLLEAAGIPDVLHLHGRYDEPLSIRTTIHQYLSQLGADTHAAMFHALRGKDVLVVGYSGRDRDVLPYLWRSRPRSITWLQHPGSALSLEVTQMPERCAAAGVEFTVEECTIPELADARGVKLDVCATQLLNETARADVAGGSVQTVELPISARVSAIFQIMTNLAHAESAERYLDAIRAVHPEINQAFMRKPKARNLSSQGRDSGALQVLLVEPILHREFRSMPDLANEMAAVVKRKTRGAGVDRVLAAISGSDGRPWLQKTHIAASQRIAQTSSLRGQVGEALSRMKQVEGRIDDDLAPQVRVNAMIFHADYLRAAGYLREAQEKIRYAMTDAPFTQLATKTYTVLFSAHSALCLGEVERALAELTFAEQLATPTGDSSGSSRIRSALLGSIAHVRSNALMALGDFERAHCSLDPARSLADGGWTHKLGAPLTELHELALLRARCDFRACIDEAQRLVSRRGGLRDYPQLALAAELISTEVAYFELGDLTEQRTKTMLEDIAMRFRARGYRSAAGRASISAAKVTGDPISAAVVEEWDKLGWQREIQWLDGETETPPHWVLPF